MNYNDVPCEVVDTLGFFVTEWVYIICSFVSYVPSIVIHCILFDAVVFISLDANPDAFVVVPTSQIKIVFANQCSCRPSATCVCHHLPCFNLGEYTIKLVHMLDKVLRGKANSALACTIHNPISCQLHVPDCACITENELIHCGVVKSEKGGRWEVTQEVRCKVIIWHWCLTMMSSGQKCSNSKMKWKQIQNCTFCNYPTMLAL